MADTQVYPWIIQQDRRKKILIAMRQPSTAKQIARNTGIPVDTCSYLLIIFTAKGLLKCLNPQARSSRLYGLTTLGKKYRKHLHRVLDRPYKEYIFPDIPWTLYGWVCFNHRSTVLKTLSEPMQPSEIKRFLRIHHARMKISANNIRDVIKLLLARKIVRPVRVKNKAHLRYELTELGHQIRQLLLNAQVGL